MSFLAQISNAFSGNKQQQPAPDQGQQTNQPQPNQGQQQQQQQAPINNPSQGGNVDGTNKPVDPVEFYNKMWSNNPNQQGEAPPKLAIDPKTLDQVSSQLDFMQGAPQELVQKATNGDVQALMALMNHVSKNAYRTSMQHQSAVTDAFVGQREEFFGKRIPGVIKDELTMNNLAGGAKTPSYVRQQLADIAKKYQAANPDASPEEVAQAARQYVADLSKAVNGDPNGQQGQQGQQRQQQETDWDAYFDSN